MAGLNSNKYASSITANARDAGQQSRLKSQRILHPKEVTAWRERVELPVTGTETCTGRNIRFAQLSDHQPATLVYTKRPLLAHVAGKVFPESKKKGTLRMQFSVRLKGLPLWAWKPKKFCRELQIKLLNFL